MFDRLEDLLIRYEELMSELSEPDVANNPERFRKLMKEQSDLTPIVEAYKEYKQCKQNIEDSLAMLDEETGEENETDKTGIPSCVGIFCIRSCGSGADAGSNGLCRGRDKKWYKAYDGSSADHARDADGNRRKGSADP